MAFDYNFNSHTFWSPGYLTIDVPQVVKDELKKVINDLEESKIENIDIRYKLAGHIEKEYELPITPNIKYLAETLSFEYDKIFYNSRDKFKNYPAETLKNNKIEYSLKTLWINYSKKHDFNPPHTHSGEFSFVIWVEIPFNVQDELEVYSPNGSQASLFNFQYTDSLGQLSKETLYVDKDWEWKMVFFPAQLSHYVNPFYTSDDYRISIAGNVYVELNEIS